MIVIPDERWKEAYALFMYSELYYSDMSWEEFIYNLNPLLYDTRDAYIFKTAYYMGIIKGTHSMVDGGY